MGKQILPRAPAERLDLGQFQEYLASTTHPRRVMTLQELANMAVFMASDKASGMTGTTVNLTMGSLDDQLYRLVMEKALGLVSKSVS